MNRRGFLERLVSATVTLSLIPASLAASGVSSTMGRFYSLCPNGDQVDLSWFSAFFPNAPPGTLEAFKYIALPQANLTRHRRLTYFLAQCAHESVGFGTLLETCTGEQYEGREGLGNCEEGDGPRFKGRGWLQITGRFNYTLLEQATGIDAVAHPELLEYPDQAAIAAVWYWGRIDGNRYADRGDFSGLTYAINGGHTGYTDRQRWLRRIEEVTG